MASFRNGRFAIIKALRSIEARQGEDIRAMGAAEGPETPIRLFYSYSHRDEELRKKLEDHLAALRWSGRIAVAGRIAEVLEPPRRFAGALVGG